MRFVLFWVHSGPFGCLTKLGAKWAELLQKFVPRSRVGIFRESIRSTTLDPKLMFWCVLYYLGAFGTVWFHTKLGAKRAELEQKFVPRSRVGFFHNERIQSTALDPKTDILECFLLFGCIRDRLVSLRNSVQNEPN